MSMMLLWIYFGAVIMLLPQLVLRFTFMADSGEVNDDGYHFWCFSALFCFGSSENQNPSN